VRGFRKVVKEPDMWTGRRPALRILRAHRSECVSESCAVGLFVSASVADFQKGLTRVIMWMGARLALRF
jgi:hypothetical protein